MVVTRNRRRVARREEALRMAGTVAAGVVSACLLAGAPVAALLALAGGPGDVVRVPGVGLDGHVTLVFGVVSLALMAPLLVSAGAVLWLSTTASVWFARAGFVAAVALAILAGSPAAIGFGAALAVGLVVILPVTEPLALGLLPLLAVSLLIRLPLVLDPAAARAIGWLLAGGAALVMPAAAVISARAGGLGALARAVAVALGALAVLGAGLVLAGAVPAAGWAIAREAATAAAFAVPILTLAAAILRAATGTDGLDWLGGLGRGMPVFSGCLLAGSFAVAMLPPGPGFAAMRDLIAAAAGAGAGLRLPLAVLAASASVASAALAFAALRGFALICLGRPRSLRAAAAEEVAPRLRQGLIVLAAASMVAGIADGGAGYRPAVLAVLMALVAFGVLAAIARRGGGAEAADWRDGAGRPPSWLPFGEPATQMTARGFLPPGWPQSGWLRPGRVDRLRNALAWLFAP